MKQLMTIRSKRAVVGLMIVLASALPGSATVLHVPADYSTIQAAVDAAAASGDTIQIAPGVYTNQVVITKKSLTLSGSPGTILRATPGMKQTLFPIADPQAGGVSLLGIFESTNVVVSGLTFEGERLADSQPGRLHGIWFLAAGGSVVDCRITGFRGSALNSGTNHLGVGVYAINPQGYGFGPVNVQVRRSTFADNTVSIWLIGDLPSGSQSWHPELLSTTFSVDDNTIIGNGPVATGLQFGIYVWAGAGGEVERNTVTDHQYVGTIPPGSPSSFGVGAVDGHDLALRAPAQALQPIHFEGNILTNNQVDLVLVLGDGSTVVNNSFEGTAPVYRAGFIFSGANILVASNRFSNMQTGILVSGNDPVWGTALGVASNAVLVANGFCNVATDYVFDPQTTYDLQSTLDCPPPTLSDTRAVLLSWPYNIQGYSVESAPTPSGPWTTNSDATVFLQDGQNSVAIPADSDQQYFQLVKQQP